MRAWCWLALVGCGRLGFDAGTTGVMTDGERDTQSPRPCVAPVGHDDDGDGIDDACDGCPVLADSAQPDRDQDGVDDLCDPHPDAPGDHIAEFDPFVTLRPEWSLDTGVVLGTDQLLMDGRSVGILHATWFLSPTRDVFTIRGHVSGTSASGQRQINIRLRVGQAFNYASLFDPGTGATSMSIAYTPDNSSFTVLMATPMTGALTNGDFVLSFVNDPPNATAEVTWGGIGATAVGTPPSITPDHIEVAVIGLDVQVDAYARIHTD